MTNHHLDRRLHANEPATDRTRLVVEQGVEAAASFPRHAEFDNRGGLPGILADVADRDRGQRAIWTRDPAADAQNGLPPMFHLSPHPTAPRAIS